MILLIFLTQVINSNAHLKRKLIRINTAVAEKSSQEKKDEITYFL